MALADNLNMLLYRPEQDNRNPQQLKDPSLLGFRV